MSSMYYWMETRRKSHGECHNHSISHSNNRKPKFTDGLLRADPLPLPPCHCSGFPSCDCVHLDHPYSDREKHETTPSPGSSMCDKMIRGRWKSESVRRWRIGSSVTNKGPLDFPKRYLCGAAGAFSCRWAFSGRCLWHFGVDNRDLGIMPRWHEECWTSCQPGC